MTIAVNDLGNPSSQPCGVDVVGICGSGDYESWYRAQSNLVAALSTRVDDPAVRAWMGVAQEFPEPGALKVSFFPSNTTRELAQHVQRGLDLAESFELPEPEQMQRNREQREAMGTSGLDSLAWGALIGIGLAIGVAYAVGKARG